MLCWVFLDLFLIFFALDNANRSKYNEAVVTRFDISVMRCQTSAGKHLLRVSQFNRNLICLSPNSISFYFSFLNPLAGWQNKSTIHLYHLIHQCHRLPTCDVLFNFFFCMFLLWIKICARLLIVINTTISQGTHQHWVARAVYPGRRSIAKHDSFQAAHSGHIAITSERIANTDARSDNQGKHKLHFKVSATRHKH